MTNAKTAKQKNYGVYTVDESAPDLNALFLPASLSRPDFEKWLGQRLGQYRSSESIREQTPSRSEEIDYLEGLVQDLKRVIERLEPLQVPPWSAALLHDIAYKAGRSWRSIERQCLLDMYFMKAAAGEAKKQMRALNLKIGRKPSTSRDRLLADVIGKFTEGGLTKAKARDLAKEVLIKSRVPITENIKRAAKRGQKLI